MSSSSPAALTRAMQDRGLRVISPDSDFDVKSVTGDLAAIGTADIVFLGVKAHSLTALAPQLPPLFSQDTVVVSTQNGLPWWYFQGHGGTFEGLHLDCIDPGGVIAAAIEPRRVVGSLAYFSTDVPNQALFTTPKATASALASRTARSERTRTIAEATSPRLPLPGDDEVVMRSG
jgi:ketopantoate reductase